MLTDKNNEKIYIGVTSNLLNRVLQHKQKLVDGYTKKYELNKLVYYEEFLDMYAAIKREKQLKGRLRIRKIKLIESKNPGWIDLYDTILNSS
jgi:putative endonuclease